LLIGEVRPATWRDPSPPGADFFAAKGALTSLLATLRVPWTAERGSEPFLHPGRSAQISIGGKPAGWLGEIHPLVAAEWELSMAVAGFELDLDAAFASVPSTALYEDVTSFPAIREDVSVIVGEDVSAEQVLAVVRAAGAPLLTDAQVFDVYRDEERVGAESVSLALRLTYHAPDRTLTDDEVAGPRKAIVAALAAELCGRVREG
jgi:phenylalanyl-tRNA synthetase beta chain